ncbi:hypothetical protein AAFF_G00212050 [Aldrovandia affinis]|uniref:Uncharacterized protein n=1 Tax=Aldrovandia affinis TaxID=143900 RepID=A0AAD7W5D8_9TELE|nr:hypothetical protein AAFF_G00212050 [Aldrovandia affinis]
MEPLPLLDRCFTSLACHSYTTAMDGSSIREQENRCLDILNVWSVSNRLSSSSRSGARPDQKGLGGSAVLILTSERRAIDAPPRAAWRPLLRAHSVITMHSPARSILRSFN